MTKKFCEDQQVLRRPSLVLRRPKVLRARSMFLRSFCGICGDCLFSQREDQKCRRDLRRRQVCSKTVRNNSISWLAINCLHFSSCACHACAGAMLIFSVSFMLPWLFDSEEYFWSGWNALCVALEAGGP